jgi:alkylation response protein AidB-like acyl-CoA dehydrogenase
MLKLSISEAEATGVPGLGSSALKLAFTHVYQGIGELGVRVLGRAGLSLVDFFDVPVRNIEMRFFYGISIAIAAGSTQIQKNIIAERMQGLPKDR